MTIPAPGKGPLAGVKVVEIAGLGPGPHACMILSDLGADVIRIERPGGNPLGGGPTDFTTRGRPSVALDLKHPKAVEAVLSLVEQADMLVEGMRPGAMERLGLGPEDCWRQNPQLVYGRMTGWGQDGPWALIAGHDLNYVAVTGVLDTLGQDPARPHFPSNLLGDFGGGSTYLVIGILAALHEAGKSGHGQVVDAAIVDGTAHLNAMASGFLAAGRLTPERGTNLLDGGAPFYDVYRTADGRHLSVGALEPQFYAELISVLGIEDLPDREDPANHPEIRQQIAAKIESGPLAHWAEVFAGRDACVAPVLTMSEAPEHEHMAARKVFIDIEGQCQPAPAPRFSRTPGAVRTPPAREAGQDTIAALTKWGFGSIDELLKSGAAYQA